VRLPDEFVNHVHVTRIGQHGAPRPTFDERGQRDREWPGPEYSSRLWQLAGGVLSDGAYLVDVETSWWLRQTGLPSIEGEAHQ
jgi:hypothetical protein